MPELPEVETVRRELAAVLVGERIRGVTLRLPKMLKSPRWQFRRGVIGARVLGVGRRAKLLLCCLSTGWTMVFHLKMSGQLIWQPRQGRLRGGGHPIPGALEVLPNKYSHVIFSFEGGTLYFNDLRQFGFVRLVRTVRLADWFADQGLGPEVVSGSLPLSAFLERLRARRISPLKVVLMDQRFVAGLGNIYADESLFAARLRPTRRVGSLSLAEQRRLYGAIKRVLALAVRKGGTTLRFFRRPNGSLGGMRPHLKVYGRAGEPCRRCGVSIRKMRFRQRGTHFCPRCQR